MKYWDYCVRSECDALGAAKTAKELGWEGIVVLSEEGGKFPAPSSGAKIRRGILVRPKSKEQLKKAVKKKRAECALIAVESRDDETNRAAVETPEVDILLPGSETKIDVVMAKLARESDVTIAFEFSALLHSSLEDRGRHFSQMLKNAGSVRKFRAPFVISSGAVSEFGLRAPSDLVSFGKILGFGEPGIKASMSEGLISEKDKRSSGRWVMPGVEVEK